MKYNSLKMLNQKFLHILFVSCICINCHATTPPPPGPCPSNLANKSASELGKIVGDPKINYDEKRCANIELVAKGEEAVAALIDLLQVQDINVWNFVMEDIQTLGPKAKAAAPYLIGQLDWHADLAPKGFSYSMLYHAIGEIGETGKPAIPYLMQIVGLQGRDYVSAIDALGMLGKYDPNTVVPFLAKVIKQERIAVSALGRIGKNAKAAAPAIRTQLEADIVASEQGDWNLYNAGEDISALVRIEESESIVPLLLRHLHRHGLEVKIVNGLRDIGPAATQAVPELLRQMDERETSGEVRDAIIEALSKIAPTNPVILNRLLLEATERSNYVAQRGLAGIAPLPRDFAPKLRLALQRDPSNPNLQQALQHVAEN